MLHAPSAKRERGMGERRRGCAGLLFALRLLPTIILQRGAGHALPRRSSGGALICLDDRDLPHHLGTSERRFDRILPDADGVPSRGSFRG